MLSPRVERHIFPKNKNVFRGVSNFQTLDRLVTGIYLRWYRPVGSLGLLLYPRSKGEGGICILFYSCVSVCLSICRSVCLFVTKNPVVFFSATFHYRCLTFKLTICLGIPYYGIMIDVNFMFNDELVGGFFQPIKHILRFLLYNLTGKIICWNVVEIF